MVIKFESYIADVIGEYYEDYETNYKNGYQQNDLEQRVNNYKKVLNILGYFEHYLSQTYIENKRNFIKVDNIATIEYEIENNKNEVIVKNIFFKDKQQGLQYPNKKKNNQVNNNTNNQPDKEILSNFHYGWRKIEKNHFYNLENIQGKLFSPKWYTYIGDFKKNSDSVNAQRDNINYLLDLETGYELSSTASTGYTTENKKKPHITEEIQKSLDFMWRLLKVS